MNVIEWIDSKTGDRAGWVLMLGFVGFVLAILITGFQQDRKACANLFARAHTFQDSVSVVKAISSCEVWVVKR